MFIGHFGVGFGAKAAAPKTSLGTLFLASQFVDLLWPTLLLVGAERVRIVPGITKVTPLDFESYPISHSLLAVFGWAVLFALFYQAIKRYPRGAVVLGLVVVSHWLLDLIVHRPDLPLVPGSSVKVGFDLWASLPGTLVVEMAIFVVGVALYRGEGCCRYVGTMGADNLPGGRLPKQPVRASASERRGAGLGGTVPVVAGSVGVLGGPA